MTDGKILCDFSMYPLDAGPSLSSYVADSIKIIEESNLDYYPAPMSTSIEGEFDECMDIIKKCYLKMKEKSDRIAVNIRIDYRKDRASGILSKLASVEAKLGHRMKNRKQE